MKKFLEILKEISFINFIMMTVAGIINAFGITVFLAPVKLYDSGISGTAMLLSRIKPSWLSLSVFLIVLNIPLFLYGLKKQGGVISGIGSGLALRFGGAIVYVLRKYLITHLKGAKMTDHNISPVFDKNCKVLILGSFPSVKSRESGFFYGHPKNRFWRVLARIFSEPIPQTISEKRELLLRNHIAVWDVIKSCEIIGSDDSSIKNVIPNDLSAILENCDIRQIFCNGATSYKLYNKHLAEKIDIKAVKLPSTSPANASYSLDRLYESWKIITYSKK